MSRVRPQRWFIRRVQTQGRHLLPLFFFPFSGAQIFAESADTFDKTIRPILADRCIACHSTKKQKGDLDLERFTSLAEVKKDPVVWQVIPNWRRDWVISFGRQRRTKNCARSPHPANCTNPRRSQCRRAA